MATYQGHLPSINKCSNTGVRKQQSSPALFKLSAATYSWCCEINLVGFGFFNLILIFYYSWFTMFCQILLYSKVTQLYIYAFFFHNIFYHVVLQAIEYSSLCNTAGPHCLSILNETRTPCAIYLDSTYKWYHTVFVFFWLYLVWESLVYYLFPIMEWNS